MQRRWRPFRAGGIFQPIAEEGNLRRVALRGAGFRSAAKTINLIIQTGATVILARVLTPADFGLVAMVTTFSLVLMSFGLNGFTEATIQWEDLDQATASNLFWINLGGGLVLTLGFAAAGSLLARFYHNALVANVTIAISPSIFISCASYQHLALLKRAMRFRGVSANEVCARFVAVTIAIVLALEGFGYWALVAAIVAHEVSSTVGAWWLCRWVPSLPGRTAPTSSMVRFALNVYARYGIRHFSRNMDKLLVGWRFNASALGFYRKAYDLFALSADHLVGPLEDVALATLSRLNRDPVRFRRYLVSALAVIAFVGMGLGVDLALVGDDVVRLVLGPQWGEAGRIFILFGPGIGVMLLHSGSGWVHLAIGRPDRWLHWTIGEFGFMLVAFLVSLRWGPEGVAAAWSACLWILVVPAFWFAGKPIRLGISPLVTAAWKFVTAALVAGCVAAAIIHATITFALPTGPLQALTGIITISAVFAPLYLGAVIALHRGLAPIHQLAGVAREMMPSRAKPPALAVAARAVAGSEQVPVPADRERA